MATSWRSVKYPNPIPSTTAIPGVIETIHRHSSAMAARTGCGSCQHRVRLTKEHVLLQRRPLCPRRPYRRAFDSVWATLKRMYYQSGESAREWDRLRTDLEPRAEQARSESAFEDVIDLMIARQPLVKPRVTSSRAVVVSAHPLASEAGRAILARGGNVVDAAIAMSFVLGVVEPDASGIGGDGQAVLFLERNGRSRR